MILNLVYEANIKPETSKPNPNSDRNQKETFIKEKYVHKTFISSTTVEVILGTHEGPLQGPEIFNWSQEIFLLFGSIDFYPE